jgi:DNA-binding MarR family transcriptional regulator
METISIPIQELLDKAPSHTISELADMYQTDYGTVYRLLSRNNVYPKRAYEPLTKEALEEVFEEPRTIEGAAQLLNISTYAVGSAIKRHGLLGGGRKPTTKNRFVGERSFKVLGYLLRNPEESMNSISKKFNVTREYVRQIKEVAIAEGIIKQEVEPYEQ